MGLPRRPDDSIGTPRNDTKKDVIANREQSVAGSNLVVKRLPRPADLARSHRFMNSQCRNDNNNSKNKKAPNGA